MFNSYVILSQFMRAMNQVTSCKPFTDPDERTNQRMDQTEAITGLDSGNNIRSTHTLLKNNPKISALNKHERNSLPLPKKHLVIHVIVSFALLDQVVQVYDSACSHRSAPQWKTWGKDLYRKHFPRIWILKKISNLSELEPVGALLIPGSYSHDR
jgi:hypothetical protein